MPGCCGKLAERAWWPCPFAGLDDSARCGRVSAATESSACSRVPWSRAWVPGSTSWTRGCLPTGDGRAGRSAVHWVDRLYRPTRPGVAGARMRYWRRDTSVSGRDRRLDGRSGDHIVTPMANPDGHLRLPAFVAPALSGGGVGSVAQDLSYNGSALWLHSSPDPPADVGQADLSAITGPPVQCLAWMPSSRGSGGCWRRHRCEEGRCERLGVGSWSARFGMPAPPPAPTRSDRNSGGPRDTAALVTVSAQIAEHHDALVIWSFFAPWVGYLTLPVAVPALWCSPDRKPRAADHRPRWPER